MGRHAGGFIHHQQMPVLPYDGQRPIAGSGQDLGGPVVSGLHLQYISRVQNVHGAGVAAVYQNAVFRPGQPGHGVGGKVQPRL